MQPGKIGGWDLGSGFLSCLSAYEISKQPAEKYLYKYPATPAAQQVIQAVTHRTVNPLCNSWPIKKVNQGIGGELGLLSTPGAFLCPTLCLPA